MAVGGNFLGGNQRGNGKCKGLQRIMRTTKQLRNIKEQ